MKKILYIANPESIHDIKWISYFSLRNEEYTCYLLSEKEQDISTETREKLIELNIHILPQIDGFSIRNPFKTLKSIVQLKKHVKSIRPDLLHVLFATPFALWINFVNVKSIVTFRGSDILKVIPSLLEQKGMKKFYFQWLFRRFKSVFRKVEFVTCTSRSQEKKIRELFPETKVHLIRTGIDVERIQNLKDRNTPFHIPENKKVVLSPRYFSPIYHIELQLNAIAFFEKSELSSLFFVFIRGRNFDPSYSKRLGSRLNELRDLKGLDFIILDHLDQESLWILNHRANLCIMTPLSDGTPNTALEAMATRTPLILPPLPYDEELFSKSCIFLKNYDVTELVEVIRLCINSYDPEMLDRAWQNVNSFGNRDKEMEKLRDLIQ